MKRGLVLALLAVCVFAVVAAVIVRLMPAPLKDSDYLLAGSVATLIALAVLFLALLSTSLKSPDAFFRRRKKR